MGTVINSIPIGARVEIFNRIGDPVAAGALLEDWTVSTVSEYRSVITDRPPDALRYLGGALAQVTDGTLGFSGEVKQFGASLWAGTSPATFNFSLEFAMTYSGLEEVSKPLARIKRLVVPAEKKFGNLLAPGPSILEALKFTNYVSPRGFAPAPDEINISDDKNYNSDDAILSVRVGAMTFDRLVITSAETTVGKYHDDSGYPIYGRVAIIMQTLWIPTKEDVGHWFGL